MTASLLMETSHARGNLVMCSHSSNDGLGLSYGTLDPRERNTRMFTVTSKGKFKARVKYKEPNKNGGKEVKKEHA